MSDEPECVVPLPDGQTIGMTVEEVAGLWNQIPEIYNAGRMVRMAARADFVQPASYGLAEADLPYARTMAKGWIRPGGFGVWPVGVPSLVFHEEGGLLLRPGHLTHPLKNADDVEVRGYWRLVFSRVPDIAVMQCSWDDRDAFERLADAMLRSSAQSLANQLMLMMDKERREALESSDEMVLDPAVQLLKRLEIAPAISEDDYAPLLNSKGVLLQQAQIFDPDLFRFIEAPGILSAFAPTGMSLRDFDALLSQAGLLALRGFSTQGWGDTQRLAVKRGYRSRMGSVSPEVWQVLAPPPAPTNSNSASPFSSLNWWREAVLRGLGVVERTPLSVAEWREIKSVRACG